MHKPKRIDEPFRSVKTRNIIVLCTAVFISGAIIFFVMSTYAPRQFTRVTLPVMREYNGSLRHGPDPTSSAIEIDRSGALYLHNKPFTADKIRAYLTAKHRRYGDFPVCIAAAAETPCSAIYSTIALIRAAMDDPMYIHFIITTDPLQQRAIPIGARIAPDPEVDLIDMVAVSIDGDRIMMGDNIVSTDELKRNFDRLGMRSRSTEIEVRASGSTSYSKLTTILAVADIGGFMNIRLVLPESIYPDAQLPLHSRD